MDNIHKTIVSVVLSAAASLGLLLSGGQALSGSLEPPASAFDANGNPVATGNTSPSWDKQLVSTNGDTAPGRVGCDSDRFTCMWGDTAVRDNETGVVWARSPSSGNLPPGPIGFTREISLFCADIEIGGRKGWRHPSREELASLIDTTNIAPALPTGHPFTNVPNGLVWTGTEDPVFPGTYWTVRIGDGAVFDTAALNDTPEIWCVRGERHTDR